MMKDGKNQEEKKKTYEKPRLRIIELAAEEVLASGCKLTSGGSAFNAIPCSASNCLGTNFS
jgi:hypothetical protein